MYMYTCSFIPYTSYRLSKLTFDGQIEIDDMNENNRFLADFDNNFKKRPIPTTMTVLVTATVEFFFLLTISHTRSFSTGAEVGWK